MKRSGLILGLGLGGLVDGFVLHQLLQWHHLWSARTPSTTLRGLEANTLADGVFHMTSLVVVIVGIVMLMRADSRATDTRSLLSFGLVGWGIFNVLDQIVFHLALQAHHIRVDVENYQIYDWSFFALGLMLIAAGWKLDRKRASPEMVLTDQGS